MDSITRDEYERRLGILCLRSGVVGLPRSDRDRRILLHSVTRFLERGRTFTEKELDARILAWMHDVGRRVETDHVSIRRALVDHGFVERDGYGSAYSVRAGAAAFAADVEAIDVARFIAEEEAAIARKRAAHREGAGREAGAGRESGTGREAEAGRS